MGDLSFVIHHEEFINRFYRCTQMIACISTKPNNILILQRNLFFVFKYETHDYTHGLPSGVPGTKLHKKSNTSKVSHF